ncbi:MAG: hypothetical protein II515_01840 [Desulfovibrio sp.]|nr:hypothetical protein [Desulfovibrio sp.]
MGKLPNSTAVSCNVLCSSPRKTAGGRCKALDAKGWGIPVDIMDAKGDDLLPVAKGVHRQEAAVGTSLSGCGSLLILTLQGPAMGSFGRSLKNNAIGGKVQVTGVAEPDGTARAARQRTRGRPPPSVTQAGIRGRGARGGRGQEKGGRDGGMGRRCAPCRAATVWRQAGS